jgi:hypothetical protein
LHDLATAAQGKQSKKHHPLIPEFHRVTTRPKGEQLPEGTKLLPPHLGGVLREEEKLNKANEVTAGDHAQFDKVGYYHTPKQFLSMGKQTLHPMDTTDHLEEPIQFALDCNLQYPPQL